jgi:hypothetical protein
MRKGDRVFTIEGNGTITGCVKTNGRNITQYQVELDEKPFGYSTNLFWYFIKDIDQLAKQ